MKDIDFDELDRAVNSLMSTVPSDKPADATTQAQPAPATTDTTDDSTILNEQPQNTAIESVPTVLNLDTPAATPETGIVQEQTEVETLTEAMQLVEETPTPTPAPAMRRGRFMDVVRPTVRDVNKSTPSSTVSRQGVSLQPSVLQPEEAPTAPDMMSSQQDDDTAVEQSSSEAVFPDFTAFENIGDAGSTAPEASDSEAPLSSPFLPDAKVEKRPLGRPLESAPTVDLAAELAGAEPEASATSAVVEDTIPPNKDAQLPEQPLPAELGSELLSIETNADNLPSEMPQPAAVAESAPAFTAPSASAPEPARVMTGASIPQQYKVQPQQNREETPSGAIYDAQPLVHTAEKKSGWIWKLVAIIAIALLGAGGGAAIYYLNLI